MAFCAGAENRTQWYSGSPGLINGHSLPDILGYRMAIRYWIFQL